MNNIINSFILAFLVTFSSMAQETERTPLTITWPDNSQSEIVLVGHKETIELKESNDTMTISTPYEIITHYTLEGGTELEFNSVLDEFEEGIDLVHNSSLDTSNYVASDSIHYVNRAADYLTGQATIRVRKKEDTLTIATIELEDAWGTICTHNITGSNNFCFSSEHFEDIYFGAVRVEKLLGLSTNNPGFEVLVDGGYLIIEDKIGRNFLLIDNGGRVINDKILSNRRTYLGTWKPGLYFLKSNEGSVQKILLN